MFRKLMLAIAAVALSATAVQASDLYEPKADRAFENPQILFDGLGVDAGVGYAMTAVDVDTAPLGGSTQFRGISADGFTGVIGLDYMFVAGKFRVGPYAEYGVADVTTELNDLDVLKQDAFYGGGLQFGFVEGTSFFGVRVGYEWQDWVASSGKDSVDVDAEALLVGVVYSMALLDSVELKLTVDALNYRDISVDGNPDFPANDIFDDSLQGRAMARIVWRPDFN